MKFLVKPPTTPSYLSLLFFVANLYLTASNFLSTATYQEKWLDMLALPIFFCSSWSIYLLGNLPLTDTLPSASVASPFEVR